MKVKYSVEGLDCPNCAAKLEKMIAANDALTSVKLNFIAERLTVETETLSVDAIDAYVSACATRFSSDVTVKRI